MPFESGVDIIALTTSSSSSRARLRPGWLIIVVRLLLQITLRFFHGGLQTSSLSTILSGLWWLWCVKSGDCSRCFWACWDWRNVPCIVCLNDWRQSFWFLWYWSFLSLRCCRKATTTLLHYTSHWLSSALSLCCRRGFGWSDCRVFRHLVLSDIIRLTCFIISYEVSLVDLSTETRRCKRTRWITVCGSDWVRRFASLGLTALWCFQLLNKSLLFLVKWVEYAARSCILISFNSFVINVLHTSWYDSLLPVGLI